MCDIGAMWTMRPCRGPTSCRPSLCSASRPIVVAHGSRTMATKGCISSSSYQRDAKQTGLAPRHAHPGLLSEARHQRWAAPLRCQKVDSSVLEVGNKEKLIDYICAGPLADKVGLTHERMGGLVDEWIPLAEKMCDRLGLCHEKLDSVGSSRVYLYYLPVFQWCRDQLAGCKTESDVALVVGINAPQGCGKTTIVAELVELFSACDVGATFFSVDDFYLTFAEQNRVAEANPGNPLLKMRGNAGSHDLQLGSETISAFRKLTQKEMSAKAPRYDKSLNQGRGDRAPESQWDTINGPLSIILVEGWMFGFSPLPDEDVAALNPDLVNVNKALRQYKAAWDSLVDCWIVIQVDEPDWVFQWRLQAEHNMKASGKPGMTDDQIRDFVSRFMPAYQAYLPGLYKDGPTTAKPDHLLQIRINQTRQVIP